jgi:predicted nucleic acid-binding protein
MPNGSNSRRVFLDTNVLAYSDDVRAPQKQQRSIDLVKQHRRQNTGVVSIQVLQEYFVCATGKFKLDANVARRKIETFSQFHVVRPDPADILAAIDIHRLHRVSFWDALILHSAKQAGCRVLLTEDMQHGQTIDGVKIVNPFI